MDGAAEWVATDDLFQGTPEESMGPDFRTVPGLSTPAPDVPDETGARFQH
jgi:hypothetical protein